MHKSECINVRAVFLKETLLFHQARRRCTLPSRGAVRSMWSSWWRRGRTCTLRPVDASSSPKTREDTSTLVSLVPHLTQAFSVYSTSAGLYCMLWWVGVGRPLFDDVSCFCAIIKWEWHHCGGCSMASLFDVRWLHTRGGKITFRLCAYCWSHCFIDFSLETVWHKLKQTINFPHKFYLVMCCKITFNRIKTIGLLMICVILRMCNANLT